MSLQGPISRVLAISTLGLVIAIAGVLPAAGRAGWPVARVLAQAETESGSDVLVHRINLGASNVYLLETPEGMILVDAGIPYSQSLVLRKMEQLGRDDLKLIYITHADIDHYGGANALREATARADRHPPGRRGKHGAGTHGVGNGARLEEDFGQDTALD